MRVDGPCGYVQAFSSPECDGGLALLLPDANTGDDVEGHRRRMEMARIDAAGFVLNVVNGDLLAGRIWHDRLEQWRVRNDPSSLVRGRSMRIHEREDRN